MYVSSISAMALSMPGNAPSLLLREALLLTACVAGDTLFPSLLAYLYGSPSGTDSPSPPLILRLLLDNFTHATLASMVWWTVLAPPAPWPPAFSRPRPLPLPLYHEHRLLLPRPGHPAHKPCLEILLAFILGSALDLDHFIAARSFWGLQGVLHLSHRPPGHCLTSLLTLTACVWTLAHYIQGPQQGGTEPSVHARGTCGCCNQGFLLQNGQRLSLLFMSAALSHQLRDALRHGLWFCHLGFSTAPLSFHVYILLTMTLPLVIRRLLAKRGGEAERGEGPRVEERLENGEDREEREEERLAMRHAEFQLTRQRQFVV